MTNNEPRPAGAFRMCISCGERPCETTSHDCCNQCAAITKTRAYVKQGREWQEYKCECPRCGRYCLAIIEDGSTTHDCEHCDKSFNLNVEG